MTIRPTDPAGDILPVLSLSDLPSGPAAVVILIRHRLSLFTGEWWENPAWGFDILDLLRSGRPTAGSLSALSAHIASYIRQTPSVRDVTDVRTDVSSRHLSFSCRVITAEGEATLDYETSL